MTSDAADSQPQGLATTVEERTTLDEATIAAVRQLAAAAEAADGVAPLGEQPLLALSRPRPDVSHFLVWDDDELAGYAQAFDADEASTAEIAVAPTHRGRGIADAMVSELLRRHKILQFWAHGDLPGSAHIAAQHGLERCRELLKMTRHRESAPPVAADPDRDDVEVLDLVAAYRKFGADAVDAAVLRVNNAAFSWHPEQGGWSLEGLRERMSVSWFDPQGFFIAIEHTEPLRLAGFHWTKVHPAKDAEDAEDAEKPVGEVYVVGVDPATQGRGLGAMLTAVGIAYLESQGINEVDLYVEGDNEAAIRTYERLGFERSAIDVMYGNLAKTES